MKKEKSSLVKSYSKGEECSSSKRSKKSSKSEDSSLSAFATACKKLEEGNVDMQTLKALSDEMHENLDNSSAFSQIKASFTDGLLTSLLSNYSVTRSPKDALIINILKMAEKSYNIDLSKYFPLIWGEAAKKNYENLQKFGTSLHVRITPNEVISHLNPVHLWLSAKNQYRQPSDEKLYDANFLLRLFANLLQPGSELSPLLFAKSNCLSFVFTCCSSPQVNVRALAYYCLQRYMGLIMALQVEVFEERTFLIYLLRIFKQSIEHEAQRLSNIITLFFARSIDLILKTGESPISNAILVFLCLKPVVDLNNVPEFYKLLFSASTEHHTEERHWVLMLLAEGLIEPIDYNLLQNRSGLKLLLSTFTSSITDQVSKKHILACLKACVQMPSLANELFTKQNLPTWIVTAIKTPSLTYWEQNYLAQIYHRLLVSEANWLEANETNSSTSKTNHMSREAIVCMARMTGNTIIRHLYMVVKEMERNQKLGGTEEEKTQRLRKDIEKALEKKVWANSLETEESRDIEMEE